MKIIKHRGITWIDIVKPSKKDIEFIAKQHKFHPIILDELLHTSARTRVESYGQYLFLTYHMPVYDQNSKTSRKAEIDFLITKNKVITVRYEELEPINNFIRSIANSPHFKESAMDNTGKLVYSLIEEIINFCERQLSHIEENITNLTQNLFEGKEDLMLRKISYVKRDLLDYMVISRPQEIILRSLKETGIKFWDNSIIVYLSDLIGDHLKVMQRLENYQKIAESLEETNAQLLDAKINLVMQKFTILAFLTVPLLIVMQLFSIDSFNKLFGGGETDFFLASMAIVITITVIILLIFKKKRWL
jgi:magnesium transporter